MTIKLQDLQLEPEVGEEELLKGLNTFKSMFPQEINSINRFQPEIEGYLLRGELPPPGSPIYHQEFAPTSTFLDDMQSLDDVKSLDDDCLISVGGTSIEACVFFISIAGIRVKAPRKVYRLAGSKIGLQSLGHIRSIIFDLSEAIRVRNAKAAGKAVFELFKSVYKLDIHGIVIEIIKQEVSWWEWIVMGAELIAQLALWFVTGGLALIAKIALTIFDAIYLIDSVSETVNTCSSSEFSPSLA